MHKRIRNKNHKNNMDLHILLERTALIYIIVKLIANTIELIN